MTVIRDEVLKQIPDGRLKVFVVWEDVLPKDCAEAADDSAGMLADEWRAEQFWDPLAETGKRFKKLFDLHIAKPGWDIYMLFPPGVRWKDETPSPVYWMHQLTLKSGGEDDRRYGALRLDTKKLREEIERRLK